MNGKKMITSFLLLFIFVGLCFSQQNLQVQGVVKATGSNEALIGVSVRVKGTDTGTITDMEGKYAISAPRGSTLVFEYLGMVRQELAVNSSPINVVMQEDSQILDELIVIGYGVQKKSDITGAISSIKMDDITRMPVSTIDKALQGAAAGLQVVNDGGQPGATTTVRIRGISSVNNASPMWVIDGIPGNPNSVNANDIESIEVLKDASTAAIYGSSGANGVILITTKKGKAGTLIANFNAYYGIQNVIKELDMANGPQYGNYRNEIDIMTGVAQNELAYPDPSVINSLPTYNYQKEAFKRASTQNYEFSVSTGSDKGNVYFGAGYLNQDGIVKGSNYKKLNLLINSEYKLRDWFTVGERASFVRTIRDGFPDWKFQSEYESPLLAAAIFCPDQPDRRVNDKGEEVWIGDRNRNGSPAGRLYAAADERTDNYSGSATLFARIQPLKNLTFETSITGGLGFTELTSFQDTYYIENTNYRRDRNNLTRSSRKDTNWRWQNILSYNTQIADKFNVAAMLGMESGRAYWHDMRGMRNDLFSSDPNKWYFDGSTDMSSVSQIVYGGSERESFYSYFGRLSADYEGKYLAQFIFRRDASSKFGPQHRFGNFPSMSLGWKFSDESFMQNLNWLSFGKIRFGYGTSGNSSALGNYEYYSAITMRNILNYDFTNQVKPSTGSAPSMLSNPRIRWEKIETTNYGIDLGFLNNKLNLTIDYFTRKNKDMLLEVPIPNLAGWWVFDTYWEGGPSTAKSNVGTLENKGIEITAGWKQQVNKDFSYSVDGNFTYIKNKAVNLNGSPLFAGENRGTPGYLTKTVEGSGLGEFYGFKTLGIFQESDGTYETNSDGKKVWTMTNQPYKTDANGNKVYAQPDAQPGDYKFWDANGDGVVDDDDKVSLGNPHPKYLFGFTFNASYKMLDFSMFWTGSLGNKIFNGVHANTMSEGGNGSKNLPSTYVEGHWRDDVWGQNQNPATEAPLYPARKENAKWARYDNSNINQNFTRLSDIYIEDGSYVKLQNIQIGCTLPEKWIKPTTLNSVRFYIGVHNVLTFTKYKGLDPQLNSSNVLASNIDKAGYPVSRTWTFGCSINF